MKAGMREQQRKPHVFVGIFRTQANLIMYHIELPSKRLYETLPRASRTDCYRSLTASFWVPFCFVGILEVPLLLVYLHGLGR